MKLSLGIILIGLTALSLSASEEWYCSDSYDGKCRQCPYAWKDQDCHLPGPSTVYLNGVIYTVDASKPDWASNPAEAMVVENGKIKLVGSNAAAKKLVKPGVTRVVNLRWKTVLPGIHDPHMHPMEASTTLAGTCGLQQDVMPDSPDQLAAFTEEKCQNKQVGTKWVMGHGHSVWTLLKYVEDTGKDPKDILDPLIVDKQGKPLPAVMMEFTSHSVWVNSEGLRVANITKDTEDGMGAVYMRNAKGEPNGIVLENGGNIIVSKALDPKTYPELSAYNYGFLIDGLATLAANGITSCVDARNYWKRGHNEPWEKAEREGTLTVKAVLSMWAHPEEKDDDAQIAKLKSFFTNDPNSRLRKSQIKFYMDGLLNTRTARVKEEYVKKTPDYGVGDNGISYFDQARIQKYAEALQNIDGGPGFDFLLHAVGDAAVWEALNAFEAAAPMIKVPTRHKLSHVELVDRKDMARFKKLGVLADAQVTGDFTTPGSPGQIELGEYLGKERAANTVPIKWFQEEGVKVTLSSDWDVSTLNPFIGMSHAVTRGAQSVDLKSALEFYTINGAFSMRQEDRTGSLVAGKDADFIVVDQDIFDLEFNARGKDIAKTKVLYTVLEGEEILRKGV